MKQINHLHAGFDSKSVHMEPHWVVSFQAPDEDVDRIFDHLTQFVPLKQGNYDKNAFRSASGVEYYRPLAGAAAGAEEDFRKRPGVAEITFFIPHDIAILEEAIEAIFFIHSYEEPVITVQEVLRSRSRGLDDKDNPNRWWNRGGDWKSAE